MAIPSFEEFPAWALENIHADFGDSTKNVYRTNISSILLQVENNIFFKNLSEFIKFGSEKYLLETKSQLMMEDKDIILCIKPYDSLLNKLYRHNIIWNNVYPSEPKLGWATHKSFYEKIDDLIRGKLICKFIDGPQFLAKILKQYADQNRLQSKYSLRSLDKGYYAVHFYIEIPVEINTLDTDSAGQPHVINQHVNVDVEIQISTQLQDVLYQITQLLQPRPARHYT